MGVERHPTALQQGKILQEAYLKELGQRIRKLNIFLTGEKKKAICVFLYSQEIQVLCEEETNDPYKATAYYYAHKDF